MSRRRHNTFGLQIMAAVLSVILMESLYALAAPGRAASLSCDCRNLQGGVETNYEPLSLAVGQVELRQDIRKGNTAVNGPSPQLAPGYKVDYSEYVGGSDRPGAINPRPEDAEIHEGIEDVVLDLEGNLYAVGAAQSGDFPRAIYAPYRGVGDAFVSKLDASGRMIFTSYIGAQGTRPRRESHSTDHPICT